MKSRRERKSPGECQGEKGQESVIELVAVRVCTYDSRCSVQCGLGYGRMTGKLTENSLALR